MRRNKSTSGGETAVRPGRFHGGIAPDARRCPWCGELPIIEPWHGGGPRTHRIGCDTETCVVAPSAVASTRAKAIAVWNDRFEGDIRAFLAATEPPKGGSNG